MSSAVSRTLAQKEGPADLVVRNARVTTINATMPLGDFRKLYLG